MNCIHNVLVFSILISALFFPSCKSSNSNHIHHTESSSNHLKHETSPYLLQHASNPVDWYPWGEEAIAKAKAENKLIIVSVGYSACHWCHVMEHESFEDSLVSKIMNDHFISIKVDREERPDIDDIYMTACHIASGRGCGWPLNAFALPDGRPVWAGTYFPKKEWIKVMEYFLGLKEKEPEKLEEYAKNLTEGIQQSDNIQKITGESSFSKNAIKSVVERFLNNIDFKEGGRKGAPKFPMPNNYEFLLKYQFLFEYPKALEAVTTTLDKMAMGGIYDQLGGGFARYSTDEHWIVPHFEKMLYDNGQLVSLYADAYKLTKNPMYKKVVEESLEFIERELTHSNGGFYSSLDADSEDEEGKFYVWTKQEIETVLTDEQRRKLFNDYFEIKNSGNWEHGKNILYRKKHDADFIRKHKLTEAEFTKYLVDAKTKLFAQRAKRVRPGLDDKILTSWNALMLKGYTDAYNALGNKAYKQTALKNGQFIIDNMIKKDNRLDRNFKKGKSSINAFLDDYALTIDAFISLYQISFDEQWLRKAEGLAEYAIQHFGDEETSMFHYTSDIDPPLIARKMELADNVIPASNSSMARALFKLGTYLYKPAYIERSKQMLQNILAALIEQQQLGFYSNWAILYLDMLQPPYEVAIMGDNFEPIRSTLMASYLPHALFLGGTKEGGLELLKDKLMEDETMIFVCQNKVCKLPVTEPEKALGLMDF